MKRNLVKLAALLLAGTAYAAGPAKRPAAPAREPAAAAAEKAPAWEDAAQLSIRTGTIVVETPVTGISTAQETYDIFAPFDGRVEEVQTEMFSFVTVKSVLARMVSTEMAALLDSSSEESRKQTERRWQDVYSFTEVKPETEGVVTNVYIEPRTRVNKGDRLFTVAKKVVIIGKNTEPLYSALAPGMEAKMTHARSEAQFDAKLVNFLKVKGSPLVNRLWLEVTDLKNGIKVGEQFNGVLRIGSSENAMLVPRRDIIESRGRRFLITEIKTGLETEEETEILGHSSIYMRPPGPGQAGTGDPNKDGKDKKNR